MGKETRPIETRGAVAPPAIDRVPHEAAPPEAPHVAPARFVGGGERVDAIQVRISYSIIDRFSEGLYSSPNKAFEELVSNSYDAGARRVWVQVPDDLEAEGTALAVIDDGASMDLEGLRELWEIGISHKREPGAAEHAGRVPIGKFGIGKLATYVLARKLTYVCRAEGRHLAVTMDYEAARGTMSDPAPLALEVVELSPEQARAAIEEVITVPDAIPALFGDDAPQSFTAAVLTDLKPRGRDIQRGRLRWILRTALPLGDAFLLHLNGEHLESTKAEGEVDWEFVIGEQDAEAEGWPYTDSIGHDEIGPYVELPAAGRVRGVARLYDRSLKGGRSEERGRSHGFFVKVRGRLINLDDEAFGIDVELSHGVLTRFFMDVSADGLDEHLASPRESVQESQALTELRDYLLAVFNRARIARARLEEQEPADVLTSRERIAKPPPALTTGPLRRVLRRVLAGDEPDLVAMLGLDDEGVDAAREAVADDTDALLHETLIEQLYQEAPLVRYDPARRAAVVNASHPFIANYLDVHGAGEPLRLVGVTELLTQIYMLDEDLDPQVVRKVLARRDEFLRALIDIHPRSAAVVARRLRDARASEEDLEDAVADALKLLGFEVTRIGGNGKPDGVAVAPLGARAVDGGSTDYSVTYDAKSSGGDAIAAATAGTAALRTHRESYGADYTLLVAPGFQGGDDEESNLGRAAQRDGVTAIKIEDFARLVELFPFRAITPERLRGLFATRLPSDARDWVQAQVDAEAPQVPPIDDILNLTRHMSDRQDAVDVSALSVALRLKSGIEVNHRQLTAMLRGLAAIAPTTLWLQGERFALNASPTAVKAELRSSVEPVDDDIAGALKALLTSE